MSAIQLLNPFKADFSQRGLATISSDPIAPLIIGDDYSFRFQCRTAANVAQSLTSASITMAIYADPSTSITRSTGVSITGSSPTKYQILIDSDQSTETGETGKGWYQVNFTHYAVDVAFLESIAGNNRKFKITITLADGTVFSHIVGVIDVINF